MALRLALVLLGSSLAVSAQAQRSVYTDVGQAIEAEADTTIQAHGALRTRAEALYNLDLDRGLTPSGQALFPVPLADPTGQWLTHADMRLRTDVSLIVPAAGMALHVRIDALDNLALGSQPDGVPSVTTSQRPANEPIRIERAYGQVLTPFGLLAAGRMGNHWGLGMLANGGDCASCDSGDAADRIAFFTPLLGHVWGIAYDFSAIGPTTPRNHPGRVVDVEPSDDVRTITFAMIDFATDVPRRRRARAGLATLEYGAYVSHRRQDTDVPAHYLPAANPPELDRGQVMSRGFRATAVDVWGRLTLPYGRIEVEAALLTARIDQPSLLPGVELRDTYRSRQIGAAFESDFGPDHALGQSPWSLGLDAGFASGDPAPGFGALLGSRNEGPTQAAPQPGDIDGPQAFAPSDTRVDNFRFHPDYRIDRILFREIIGTVTDAIYLKPHARIRLASLGKGRLELGLAAVASMAVEVASTPGGSRGLGVELDPTLAYVSTNGFAASLEYAALFPLAGLDNPTAGLDAKPAQLLRLRLGFNF